ncbi:MULTISPECIES: pantoate--beta-alanine ligase [unclassified Sphingomonas]|uniref:pantoate--beta-alanine ligase n=1 Tax=unclassified Sphingomonas TaxID=196159 RepID=UPI0006F7514F|nr:MULTISPECIES: pantoate--beta-alanine ligase [unclassified Sphingomonas]KQX25689.1 pantoate--beta-alanine ligase [Sphingomonas sp. Root1294]KQY66678.1 pantoate--beta-alanine ligase [Sphingomonas sp. Root50]KRB90442.1 pantoate--beta-alanine ligase [Sphingomonas sp. Root720]
MQIVRNIDDLREEVSKLRISGAPVALVPTMGALHRGHIALVDAARSRGCQVVVSIFVNPTQFGPTEDLDAYPRREAADVALLEAAGAALLWAPDVATMYPQGFATSISVGGVSERWDGAARPGHFAGVATVVTKLFGQVKPDIALFGEKDFQQLAVIRRFVADLDIAIEIVGVPTQREDDGLALSSRNAYLSPEERVTARTLPRALGEAAAAIGRGGDVAAALAAATARLAEAGFDPIDYVALVDAASLEPIDRLDGQARLIAAAKLGRTRLIDNLAVEASS